MWDTFIFSGEVPKMTNQYLNIMPCLVTHKCIKRTDKRCDNFYITLGNTSYYYTMCQQILIVDSSYLF